MVLFDSRRGSRPTNGHRNNRSRWGMLRRATASSSVLSGKSTEAKLHEELSNLQATLDSQNSDLAQMKEQLHNQISETEEWKDKWNVQKYKLQTLIDMWVLREMEIEERDSKLKRSLTKPATSHTNTMVLDINKEENSNALTEGSLETEF